MSKNITLQGYYTRQGANLTNTSIHLVLSKRKQPTQRKPLDYLLAKLPTGKFIFISSLYPLAGNVFELDYKGFKYTLKLTESEAQIKEVGS